MKDTFFSESIFESFDVQAVQNKERDGELESLWASDVLTKSSSPLDCQLMWTLISLINVKIAAGIDAFALLVEDSAKFSAFFGAMINLLDHESHVSRAHLQLQYVTFLANAFQCMEKPSVRQLFVGKCLSLALWKSLSTERLGAEIKANPGLQKHWDSLMSASAATTAPTSSSSAPAPKATKKGGKRKLNADTAVKETTASNSTAGVTGHVLTGEERLIPFLVDNFLTTLSTLGSAEGERRQYLCQYLQKFAELVNDLLSQLSTRRFLRTYLDDTHFIVLCKMLIQRHAETGADSGASMDIDGVGTDAGALSEELRLLAQMVDRVDEMIGFEIEDLSGKVLSSEDLMAANNTRVAAFQRVAYSELGVAFREVYFSSIGQLGKEEVLVKHLNLCSEEQLMLIASRLEVFSSERDALALHRLLPGPTGERGALLKRFLVCILAAHLAVRPSQLEGINRLSLYPSEELLWDLNQLPASAGGAADGEVTAHAHAFLTLPKLNLQFLTMYDYLLRNFVLFRLESAYEIRQAVMESVRRMMPKRGAKGTVFSGWSRMAQPIVSISINEVAKPPIGESIPAKVVATLEVDLSKCSSDDRMEWEGLREHDVLFLVAVHDPLGAAESAVGGTRQEEEEEETRAFRRAYGVRYVRGGEVFELRDQDNVVLNDMTRPDERPNGRVGNIRRLRLRLDPSQYYYDVQSGRDCYSGLNLVVRRHSKQNNFRPILETIRDLLNAPCGSSTSGSGTGAPCGSSTSGSGTGAPCGSSTSGSGTGARCGSSTSGSGTGAPCGSSTSGSGTGAVTTKTGDEQRRHHDVPRWLHDLFLGYGAPNSAHYRVMNKRSEPITAVRTKDGALECMAAPDEHFDYADTFLSVHHAVSSFEPHKADVYVCCPTGGVGGTNANATITLASGEKVNAFRVPSSGDVATASAALCPPPYRVSVWHGVDINDAPQAFGDTGIGAAAVPASTKKRKTTKKSKNEAPVITPSATAAAVAVVSRDIVLIRPYKAVNNGPYPADVPPCNTVPFTLAQTEAIRSGMNKGLTMVVGPPGTGKTDTAVQIVANLYHNNPGQRILLITHSNAALNDLFEKIMERNVDGRHLLRLGSGETELRDSLAVGGACGSGRGQGGVFSKQGRVQWCLARRAELLAEVQRLGGTMQGQVGDVGYTCETAEYFYEYSLKSIIDSFEARLVELETRHMERKAVDDSAVKDSFPFSTFFANAPNQPLLRCSLAADLEAAKGCIVHLRRLFRELADYRAFELLRTQAHRCDYMLMKQARIVAMTCTHAALSRRKLIELGFEYHTVVMEESAQILEIETMIPLLLQKQRISGAESDDTGSALQRVVLVGDHYQLPPVIKHQVIQRYSNLDQSLFTRFIRLGVPHVMLDLQGRARPEIATLYSWRYEKKDAAGAVTQYLGNLPAVAAHSGSVGAYSTANTGFAHTFQMVDVPDFQGRGESCPSPHFYQNLGEAEYIVATYQYMRLMGYPAAKISIITTYNGQKALIKDILQQRCRSNELFGMPAAVSTVDQYQGQQNDYILLSLVRTSHVGHLRDVRRLVVSMSRARLGLYVFCRLCLFSRCAELQPVLNQLMSPICDSAAVTSAKIVPEKKGRKTAIATATTRPSNLLTLVSGEVYPTLRAVGSQSVVGGVSAHDVADVTAMGILVYQMVQSRG